MFFQILLALYAISSFVILASLFLRFGIRAFKWKKIERLWSWRPFNVAAGISTLLPVLLWLAPSFFDGGMTKYNLEGVAKALKTYRRVYGRYPTTQQGLASLVLVPKEGACGPKDLDAFIDRIDKDSKKKDFAYESDGKTFTLSAISDHLEVKGNENGKWMSFSPD